MKLIATLLAVKNEKISSVARNWLILYLEDFNINFFCELKQFHTHVCHKFRSMNNLKTKFTHAELYKVITEINVDCAFPNVDIAFRIF